MNQKLIVANMMLAVLATACGDSTYAPNGMPNNQLGNQQFPIYQQFPNSQFPNQQFPNQQFPNQQFQNQPFVNQNCNPVANNPFYYNQNFNQNYNQGCFQNQLMLNQQLQWSNNWMWQNQQPRVWMNCYGPSRNYIVSPNLQLYSPGRYVYVSRPTSSSSCKASVPVYTYRKNRTVRVYCVSCSDSNNSTSVPSDQNANTSTNSNSNSANTTNTTNSTPATSNNSRPQEVVKTMNVVWEGKAAEALYNRLNVKIEKGPNGVDQKKGSNLVCEEDKKLLGKNIFKCLLNINLTDGIVNRQENPSAKLSDKDRGYFTAAAFSENKTLVIGGENRGLDEGVLTMDGSIAAEIYRSLEAEEVDGKEEVTNNSIKSKTKGQLKCYRTINTNNPTYYCSVKIQPSTGEVQDDFNVAPGSSEASDASQTGKTSQQQQNQTQNDEITNTDPSQQQSNAQQSNAQQPNAEQPTGQQNNEAQGGN